ncbi:PTS system cellobiose-specific IIC component [Natronobacillus azotifigens]|uniref:Permease IIC component n=1 Tax=Natronobacillus azotifigens TaxID=472978 RepID=A0A9J6R967_9BACI|nr:PTS transporter subunit EIIC [Natronobacillus azotifigens]MCZ0702176.1 PTS transporter subunit EIIC [Natronobacillus azotifigens]
MSKEGTMRVKVQKFASAIQKNRYVNSVSNGLASVLPIILGGAIFTLIDTINIPAYQTFLENTGLKALTSIPPAITIDLLAIYAVFAIAYKTASQFKGDSFSAGVVALMSFLIVTPLGILDDGETMALSYEWLGATGLFVAIFVAVLVGRLSTLILSKGYYIKMPKGVPPTIEKSFAALTPAFAAIILMLIVRGLFELTPYGDVHEFIYTLVQAPLVNLSGNWWAYLIVVFAMSLLWFFGIHGTIVVMSVMMPIWVGLRLENLAAYQAGTELPHMIPGGSFFMVYTALGGTGATVGLAVLLLRAKSKRYKTLGKLAIVPGITGINEPIMFGVPLVLNMKLLLPLILAPLAVSIVAMIATFVGLVPPLRGIGVPLGTPIFISGFLEGGWRVAILQAVLLVVSLVVYYPFFKSLDKEAVRVEGEDENNGGDKKAV